MTLELISQAPVRIGGRQCRITGGKLTGQKPALKMKEVWSIRARLELKKRVRDLALFNLAIDSKLRACDLTALKVEDVAAGGEVKTRGIIVQKKTGRPGAIRNHGADARHSDQADPPPLSSLG